MESDEVWRFNGGRKGALLTMRWIDILILWLISCPLLGLAYLMARG